MKLVLAGLVLMLSSEAVLAQTPQVQLSVGSTTVQSHVSIVDLGLGVLGERQSFEILVKNLSKRRVAIDAFSFQDNLNVVWKVPEPKTGLRTRQIIDPDESIPLELEVMFDDSTEVPQVSLVEKGVEVSHFAVEYILTPLRRIPRTLISPTLPSGLGEWWSPWYRICLGAAPLGYKLDSTPNIQVNQFASGQPHPRSCGAWAQCRITQADDTDVCAEFTVQGHHQAQSFLDNARDELVYVNGTLTAMYAVRAQEPRILDVKEVAGQRK